MESVCASNMQSPPSVLPPQSRHGVRTVARTALVFGTPASASIQQGNYDSRPGDIPMTLPQIFVRRRLLLHRPQDPRMRASVRFM